MSFLEGFYDSIAKDDGKSSGPPKDARDEKLMKQMPCLHDFLTVSSVRGKPRQTGSLFIFCDQGSFKACLTDRQSDLTCWEARDSFTDLLGALETTLKEGGKQAWRKKQDKPARKK